MLSVRSEDASIMTKGNDEATREIQRRKIRTLMMHMCANVTVLTIPIQAGPKVVGDLYDGDFAKGAKFLGACSAGFAAFEFLINPTVGCWSDDHGRRLCFFLGPLGCCITSAMYAAVPQSLSVIAFVRVVGNGMNAVSGSTATMAALTDVCEGDTTLMTQSLTEFMTWASMGVVAGPTIGGVLLARFGDRPLYAIRAVISGLHALWLSKNMTETLAPENRKPFDGFPVNPFSFFDLFRTSPMLTNITVYNIFCILNEGKCVNDLNQLWMKANLKWTVAQTATWTVAGGLIGMFSGGFIAKPMLKQLGARGATSCAALFGTITYILRGAFPTGLPFWVSTVLQTGCAGAGAVRSAATKHAVSAGMGAGQYQGQYSNLRALVYVFGPLLYTRLYAFQVARGGNPGASYILCAILSYLVPEFVHRSWSDKQLFPWNSS